MNAVVETKWVEVCSTDDLIPELGVCAKINNEQVALFRVDNKVYAVNNYDPFSKANVISRGIVGDLNGKLVIASPIYKNHFDLDTGQCLEDENVYIKTYAVTVEADRVRIATA